MIESCCEAYDRAKARRDMFFKTHYRLLGGNPRNWSILFNSTTDETKRILALGKLPHCACNDSPDPEAFRAWMAKCLKDCVDPYSARGEELALEVTDE